jgi:hypothetical protein
MEKITKVQAEEMAKVAIRAYERLSGPVVENDQIDSFVSAWCHAGYIEQTAEEKFDGYIQNQIQHGLSFNSSELINLARTAFREKNEEIKRLKDALFSVAAERNHFEELSKKVRV